jgi:hypothetical protein
MSVHDIFLNKALGSEGGTAFKFLTGILVAPSTSKAQVPFLQDVIVMNKCLYLTNQRRAWGAPKKYRKEVLFQRTLFNASAQTVLSHI